MSEYRTPDDIDLTPVKKRGSEWTCPHGTTYTGSGDFIGGARNAHDEISGWLAASSEGDRSTNDVAQEILEAAPQVAELVEEWFGIESRARVRLLEAQRRTLERLP